MRGQGRVWQRGKTWWLQYSVRGKRYRESSGSERKTDAVALLKKRLAEGGQRPKAEAARVTLRDLKVLMDQDVRLNRLRSSARREIAWKRLTQHFGEDARATDVEPRSVAAYMTAREAAGAGPATVRLELAILRRAFNLAVGAGLLLPGEVPPPFPKIRLDNARQGFLEAPQLDALCRHLTPDHADLVRFLWHTGWRVNEARTLTWASVDFKGGLVRLATSKNRKSREFPFDVVPELKDLLEHRRQVTDEVQRTREMVCPLVFHVNGRAIGDFGKRWGTAAKKAGLPGRLVHDLRRSFARRMIQAGLPEGAVMKLAGWESRAVFDRYHIVALEDLRRNLRRLASSS